jgi:hypothetical protein
MSLFGRSFSQFSPGSRGNVMAPQPIILATAGLRIQRRTFTDAEMKAWGTTPQQLIAGVTGFMITPLSIRWYGNFTNFGGVGRTASFGLGSPIVQTLIAGATLFSVNGLRFSVQSITAFNIQGATELRGIGLFMTPSGSGGATLATTSGFMVEVPYILTPTL